MQNTSYKLIFKSHYFLTNKNLLLYFGIVFFKKEDMNSSTSYLLSSLFDKVYLLPGGTVWLQGIAIQQPFFKGLF